MRPKLNLQFHVLITTAHNRIPHSENMCLHFI